MDLGRCSKYNPPNSILILFNLHIPNTHTGVAIGALNSAYSIGAAVFPPIFGAILDGAWGGEYTTAAADVRKYPQEAYTHTFIFLIAAYAVSVVCSFFNIETHATSLGWKMPEGNGVEFADLASNGAGLQVREDSVEQASASCNSSNSGSMQSPPLRPSSTPDSPPLTPALPAAAVSGTIVSTLPTIASVSSCITITDKSDSAMDRALYALASSSSPAPSARAAAAPP